ncbi:hypothetical protein AFCDBAGC_4751 [Methylobacterium cerastii]|uniref:Uncharacterized protein n=2 Tax=Methylobacteriaceae TaxID=119045 RepID=A0ABQ4QQ73_9HYPH|nr:hypothetical protein AFCDBAGC_4751 [Methylobacterium cerastii]
MAAPPLTKRAAKESNGIGFPDLANGPAMTTRRLSLIAAGLLSLAATAALASGSSAPFEQYQPDPALRTAPKANLEGRVRHACAVVQARLTSAPEASLERPCGCYAKQTMRSLDESEIEAYRATGYFNDSARAKALNALDACKLQRPV